ncbi:MAG TPA: NDMA-dependent alcohol dehydrogenase [Acidimicrobiales bacterium]|nr:NDMA-dependent alcohol dehydrogenase [Acidimicrobiales bacterium]
MQSRAAVLWGVKEDWQIEEIDIGAPAPGEALVKWQAAGLCHSDEHFVTGDFVMPEEVRQQTGLASPFPMIGGHEGAGLVVEVGPGVSSVSAGDSVAASFIPACGQCRYCVTGRQSLCNQGSQLMQPGQMVDGVVRHFCRGEPLNIMAKCGTFAEHTLVSEQSVVKVDSDLPPTAVALVSCGVATGWGSAVRRAGTIAGDVVVVVGVGGVGINAVQGAAMAGARVVVAVDPVEFKRQTALQLGATHAAPSMTGAIELVRELTQGEMADRVIMVPSVMLGDLMAEGMALTGKGGTCVVTSVGPIMQTEASISLLDLAMMNKEIKGTIFGSGNPRFDIPNLLAMYRSGKLKLDELVTRTYSLDQINEGYQDMRDGKVIRGVVTFD